jgi:DNA-binding PadR family transcriptional regulator
MGGTSGSKVEPFLPLSAADFQLLLVLYEGELHAYGIARAVEEQERGRVPLELGSLYRMLSRLEKWGLLEEDPVARPSPSGPARKLYRITLLGRRVVHAEAARLREVVAEAEARLAPGKA